MRPHFAYIFGSALGLGLLALVTGLQVSSTAATARPAPQLTTTAVDRTLKGDRLPLDAAMNESARTRSPAPAGNRLPDGCEATVSPMTQSPLAHIPGRCIS
jgi:hypothetical protein